MDEVWKLAPGHPTHLVSNKGRVAKILVTTKFNKKHFAINIGRRQAAKRVFIHRLMLEAFVGPPPTVKSVCRHINDVPDDNRLENLAWGTSADNAQDAIKNGRRPVNENHQHAKLSNADVLSIRARYDTVPRDRLGAIAAEFGVSVSHICGIGKRKFWKHLSEDGSNV